MNKRLRYFHAYLVNNGIYSLAGKSIVRLIIIVLIFGAALYLAQTYISDFNENLKIFLLKWDWKLVVSLFFVSETLLGLIPPDFFIVWANSSNHPMILTALLATLSYLGGMLAYFIGYRISKIPKFNRWLINKFSSHFATFHKYGGIIIVFSALFPLPFSTITMVTGMLHYPFKKVAMLGSARVLRFFGYGYFLSLLF
ncbi:MAG: hypothetical protein KAG84_01950 [Bacteroidales bacterium]|nr:hypothetical protein [Bacteroidales bacterium]